MEIRSYNMGNIFSESEEPLATLYYEGNRIEIVVKEKKIEEPLDMEYKLANKNTYKLFQGIMYKGDTEEVDYIVEEINVRDILTKENLNAIVSRALLAREMKKHLRGSTAFLDKL